MKRKIIIFGILSVFLLATSSQAWADRKGFVRKVVIDPGHGGRDPGAIGSIAKEKDIVLAISLKLGEYIENHFDDVEVIYTRTTDEFVELHRRAQIANENKADLFISVHCNASRSNRAYGTETFVMGLHRSQENLEVAKKENASILFEDDYLETYDGYDPNSPEANIIFSFFQNIYLNQSLMMASLVQDQFRERAQRNDRGVKQAGFLVLYNITMPGILVEAGFLSNPREERYLISETGQTHIASAIFRAFREYKQYQDNLAQQQLAMLNATSNQRAGNNNRANQNIQNQQAHPDVNFRVQFATLTEQKPTDAPEFSGLKNVSFYFHDGLYKYTVGNESSMEAALAIQQNLRDAGYRDAFVVAFNNNERISSSEAVSLINQRIQTP